MLISLIFFKTCSTHMKQSPVTPRSHHVKWVCVSPIFQVKFPKTYFNCGQCHMKTIYSFICSCVPLTAVFAWDAVSYWVHRGREKVETRGQGLAGIFSGHWTHRRTISSQIPKKMFIYLSDRLNNDNYFFQSSNTPESCMEAELAKTWHLLVPL